MQGLYDPLRLGPESCGVAAEGSLGNWHGLSVPSGLTDSIEIGLSALLTFPETQYLSGVMIRDLVKS
jgi:hypothetical protein